MPPHPPSDSKTQPGESPVGAAPASNGAPQELPPQLTLPGPLQTLADKAPALARTIQFLWRLGERWGMDKCPLMAAAMAFFGLLSVFPTLLAVLAILGKTLVNRPDVRDQLLTFVQGFLPGTAGRELIAGEVTKLASSSGATTVGILSILSLLWSGRAFFDTLASVLNSIWYQARPRTWLQQQIALWGTLLGAGVLWLLSTGVFFGLRVLQSWSESIGTPHPRGWSVVGTIVSLLLTLGMFWTIYRFLPNAQPGRRGRVALIAAVVATVGWKAAEFGYVRFISGSPHYGVVYGSVASVVLTLMWLYISSSVILLGAEVAAAHEETRAAARGEAKPTVDKPEDEGKSLPATGPAAAADIELHVVDENKKKF